MNSWTMMQAFDCVPRMKPGWTGAKLQEVASYIPMLFQDGLPWPVFEKLWMDAGLSPGSIACVADLALKGT